MKNQESPIVSIKMNIEKTHCFAKIRYIKNENEFIKELYANTMQLLNIKINNFTSVLN